MLNSLINFKHLLHIWKCGDFKINLTAAGRGLLILTVLYLSQHIHYWTRKLLKAKALEIGEEYINLIIAFVQQFFYSIFYSMECGLSTCHTLYSPSRSCLYCIFLYNPSVFQAFLSPDHQSSYLGSHPLLAQLPSSLSPHGCHSCPPQAYSTISLCPCPCLLVLMSWPPACPWSPQRFLPTSIQTYDSPHRCSHLATIFPPQYT